MKRQLIKHRMLWVGVVLLLLAVICPAHARAATGSITLDLTNTTDKPEATINGDIDVYLVATLDPATRRYVPTDDFAGTETGQRIAAMDASALNANNASLSELLQSEFEQGAIGAGYTATGPIVGDEAVISDLEEGLYYVTHFFTEGGVDNLVMKSFFLSIPYEGSLDVHAAPKLGFITEEEPEEPEGGEDPRHEPSVTDDALEVKKVVVSARAEDSEKEYPFRVVLTNQTELNGTYGDLTFEGGIADFTLHDGESKKATGLPEGTKYEVWERDTFGLMPSAKTETTSEGVSFTTFTNTYIPDTDTGSTDDELEVTKHVVSARSEDKEASYTFRVTLWGSTLTGTYGDMTFDNGIAEFALHDGETCKATGLPEGTAYQVEELDSNGLVVSHEQNEDSAGTVFTNTREPDTDTDDEVVELRVKKVVVSDRDEDHTKEYGFRVKIWNNKVSFAGEHTYGDMTFVDGVAEFTLTDNEVKEATELPEGTKYTVEETDTGGLEPTSERSEDGTKVTFTNTYVPGEETDEYEVRKVVKSSDDADKEKKYGFRVTLYQKDRDEVLKLTGTYGDMEFVDGVAEFTLSDGESCKATGLPEGTIPVALEVDAQGMTSSPKLSDDHSVMTVTNTPPSENPPSDNPPTPSPTKTTSSTGGSSTPGLRVPTTGDNSLPFIGIAVAGGIAIVVGVFLSKRNKRKD